MPHSKPLVVFIHGLNTYGDETIHIGPLELHKMHAPLHELLEPRGIEFHFAEGLGSDSPENQAKRALTDLIQKGLINEERRVHLIGHSIGGLVARSLAKIWPIENGVASIITFGTPHLGAYVAERGMDFHTRSPRLYRFAKRFGYDSSTRVETFAHFTGQAIAKFNEVHPISNNIPSYSFVCEVPRAELHLPYRTLYTHFHPDVSGPSDGFILCESQKWSEVRGPYKLDHYAQSGVYLFITKRKRRAARLEFTRLMNDMADLIFSIEMPKKRL